jgi:hypothetical protein
MYFFENKLSVKESTFCENVSLKKGECLLMDKSEVTPAGRNERSAACIK